MQPSGSPFPEEFSTELDQVCVHATELLHAQAASIFLKDAESGKFVMRAAHGYNSTLVNVAEYDLGEGITGRVAQGNEYIANSRDEITSSPYHKGKYDREIWGGDPHQCHSMVAVPLRIGTQVYGLIKVESKREGEDWGRFTRTDLETLKTFMRAILYFIETNNALMAALGRLYVFVLMPFQSKFGNIFECGIAPAIRDAGMRCERIDLVVFTDDIILKLYECLRRADIVVSVMTDKNPNVFYETGYSHALGRPTIHLAESAEDIPFDLQHYPHIIYSSEKVADLKKKLEENLIRLRVPRNRQTT